MFFSVTFICYSLGVCLGSLVSGRLIFLSFLVTSRLRLNLSGLYWAAKLSCFSTNKSGIEWINAVGNNPSGINCIH